MKIYVDFDGTLFNSSKLQSKYIEIFIKHNVNKKYLEKIINEDYKKEKNFDTLAKKIINDNNLDQSILKEINSLYSNKLIFKDAIYFLEKYYKEHTLILLTLGNKSYQQKKIDSSNISKYFKDIIITNKDKSKLDIDYTNGIFIDNNPLELKKFYNSKANNLIRIKRNTDKYSKLTLDIPNIPEYISFEELINSNYIEKIGDVNHE